MAVFGFGGFLLIWMALMVFGIGTFIVAVCALVDVVRAPDAAFGPPWDNTKTAWTIGFALAFVLPAGAIVSAVLWWTQVRPALRAGRLVPRPFWAPRPAYPYVPPAGGPPMPPPAGSQQP
ncbi:MAG TPA: hypothetical protein VFQ85_02045 [Mycobacteriales bacterium]|jgi:hypothetical protein|nr:hypothetical protein [Mycobacteriales bacterium]